MQLKDMLDMSDVPKFWPSLVDFAGDVNVPVSLVRVWRHRKAIPARYWAVIEMQARRRGIQGVSASDLAALASVQKEHL